jgi:capsular polysaccharide transport system ATP-binding protein
MIALENLTKFYRTKAGRRYVLNDVSYVFEPGRSTGVLGFNGAGKSTLIRLMSGLEQPNDGRIVRSGRISWPLAFSGGFHVDSTGAQNIRFVSRIYGIDYEETLAYVADFAEIGPYMDMPVTTYSSGMRARLAFGLSLAMDFDTYLVDEVTAVGDARFQERCREAMKVKRQHADVIMVSHNISTIREYCDHAVIISDGRLETFGSMDDTIAEYQRRGLS